MAPGGRDLGRFRVNHRVACRGTTENNVPNADSTVPQDVLIFQILLVGPSTAACYCIDEPNIYIFTFCSAS